MKRVYIIHGWGGSPTSDWIPWLGEELEKKEFSVTVPEMPDSDKPSMENWTSFLSSLVAQPDLETYFVGHSIGCQAIVRYLSKLQEAAGGALLVAPLTDPDGANVPWTNEKADIEGAKTHAKKITVIYSDNDDYVPADASIAFGNSLGAKLVLDQGKGHFSDADDVTQLPAALSELIEITSQ